MPHFSTEKRDTENIIGGGEMATVHLTRQGSWARHSFLAQQLILLTSISANWYVTR